MARSNARHLLFPHGVTAAAVLGWALAVLGAGLVPLPIPAWAFFPAVAVLVAAVLAWGVPEPDYGAGGGGLPVLTGGARVVPQVSMVAMLLGVLFGFLTTGFVAAVGYGVAGIVCSAVGGLLGRRWGADRGA